MSDTNDKAMSLTELFGPPPIEIQKFLGVEVDAEKGIIKMLHSSVISKSEPSLKTYFRGAQQTVKFSFPNYEIMLQSVDSKEFDASHGARIAEENDKTSKTQATIMQLIMEQGRLGASDIHIDSLQDKAIIRSRINGELSVIREISKQTAKSYIAIIYNTLCDVAESSYIERETQDAVFKRSSLLSTNLSGVRIACGPSINGPYMVLRLLYKENIELADNVNPLVQLGYNEKQVEVLGKLTIQPSGLIIIAGPTGSGKSTTLKYVIQGMAADKGINFMSVEDPPEYNILNVRQIPVSTRSNDEDRDAAFAKAIRAALRADPDKIMIGEIRDPASASMAVTCAQTGHQVWATLHANNAFSILSRMLSLMVGPKYTEQQAVSILSDPSIINCLMFQRLVPLLCDHCKIPFRDHPDGLTDFQFFSLCNSLGEICRQEAEFGGVDQQATKEKILATIKDLVFLRNMKGCPHCKDGIKGRTVVSELVYTTQQVLDNVFKHTTTYAKKCWNYENKDQTLQANARKLILAGHCDPGEVIKIIGPLEADLNERMAPPEQAI